ncbi:MAG: sodium:proton antiporter [Candidatus Caenarcaniphilales bacterium]|nr:sodium:proton antiporter [Candidatus Caenarcaniphilales bacterium]
MTEEYYLIGLSCVFVIGIAAQWIAWRLRTPSILLLLFFGFVAGPLTGFIEPDKLLGDQLLPIVSISVAIILFEGGLSLRLAELRQVGRVIFSLISIGLLITWVVSSFAAYYFLKVDPPIATLLGAVLSVSGPTVIMPLLRHIRPVGRVGSILKWEGIMVDPIGAILAVLVFEIIIGGGFYQSTFLSIFEIIIKTAATGSLLGFLAAGVFVLLLKRFWIPDFLQNPVSLMIVIGAFTFSNIIQPESGLFTVTVMGIVLANQRIVSIKQITDFKETLSVILISILFMLLASRLKLSNFVNLDITNSFLFLSILIFVIRPITVLLSTLNTTLTWKEKLFISSLYPRGIVAAAVSSLFALRLTEVGYVGADLMVSYTFLIIVGTVVVYGLLAPFLARSFGLAKANPQGVMIIGAHGVSRMIAKSIKNEGFKVLLVDTNRENITEAKMEELPAFYANILSEHLLDQVDVSDIGRVLALTSNDEMNSLSCINLSETFGRSQTFQLSPQDKGSNLKETVPQHLRGRPLFNRRVNYNFLQEHFEKGATIKKTTLSKEFTYNDFQTLNGESAIPLFLITKPGELQVFNGDDPLYPKAGQTVISLVLQVPTNPAISEMKISSF